MSKSRKEKKTEKNWDENVSFFVKAYISFFSLFIYYSLDLFPSLYTIRCVRLMCHASPLFDIRHSLSLNFIFGYAFIVFRLYSSFVSVFFFLFCFFYAILLFSWLFSQPSTTNFAFDSFNWDIQVEWFNERTEKMREREGERGP